MILYKYMSWPLKGENYARELIESNEIYLTRPTAFNDPYDVEIVPVIEGEKSEIVDKLVEERLQIYSEEKKKYFESSIRNEVKDYSSDVLKNICNEFIQHRQKTTAVLCFTDSPSNMLMWSHYADSHKGICLEFDTEKNELTPNVFDKIYQVEYTKSYPKINFITEEKSEFYRKVYSTKYSDWKYEHEYRAIYRCAEIPDENETTELQFVDSMIGANTRVPENMIKKCKISPQTITSVICGCKMSPEQICKLKEIIANHKTKINIKRAFKRSNNFGIDIIDCA